MISKQIMALLNQLAIIFPAFLLVFTCRGFFKALSAKLMGDNTGHDDGFLSLNPLVHVNFFGFLTTLLILFVLSSLFLGIIPIEILYVFLILSGARWTNPVPINEGNFKNYRSGAILTTLAGPLSNFVLALLFLYIISYFPYHFFPKYVCFSLVQVFGAIINFAVFFGVLDLTPIPPFDGGRLLEFVLPVKFHNVIGWLEKYSIFIILALFVFPFVSDIFFGYLGLAVFYIKKGLLLLVF